MKEPDISELLINLECDYYLKIQNQILGPLSWLEVVCLHDLKTINHNDFYSTSVDGPWMRLSVNNSSGKENKSLVLNKHINNPPPIPIEQSFKEGRFQFGNVFPQIFKIKVLFQSKTSFIFLGIFLIISCSWYFFNGGGVIFLGVSSNDTLGDLISPIRSYGKDWKEMDLSSIDKIRDKYNEYFVDIECWNNNVFFVKTDEKRVLKFDSSKWSVVYKGERDIRNFFVTGPNTLVSALSYNDNWLLVNDLDSNKEIPFKDKSTGSASNLRKINYDTYSIENSSGAQILKNKQSFFSKMQESDIVKEGYWSKSYYEMLKLVVKKRNEFSNSNLLWAYHTPDFKIKSIIFLENDKVRISSSQENVSETILIDNFQGPIVKCWGNSDKVFWIVNNHGTVWRRETNKMVPIVTHTNVNEDFVDFSIASSGKVFGIKKRSIFFLD